MKPRPYARLLYLFVICALVFGQPVAAGSPKSYRQAPAGTSAPTPSTFDSPLPSPTPEPTAVGSPLPNPTPLTTSEPTGTSTPPATPPPSSTPLPTGSAVSLSLLAEPAFVTPGQTISYTLTLANNSDATATGIELSDDLPAALDYVRGSDWTYDRPARRLSRLVAPLEAGAAITFTFQARLNEMPLGSVVTNTIAAVSAAMKQPLHAESAVDVAGPATDEAWFDTRGGWLRSQDGHVALKLARGSVSGATQIGYKARPDLMGLEGSLRYAFSLDAHDAAGQPQHRFAAPLELALSYRPGDFPADPALALRLVYYNEATQTWEHLPTQADARRHQLRTQINHLSLFGVMAASTEPPTFTTERMSQVRGAQGNLFNLSIAYDYDFRLPAGSGGLTPRLGLHYDSTNHYSQQSHLSLVGGGWGVTGADFVYSTPGGVETTLALQGHTYTLVSYQGGWFAKEDPLLRIQHTAVDDPYFGSANYSDWRVTTRDGVVYHFRAEATHSVNSFNLPYPGEFYWGCTPQGNPNVWRNLKWVRVPLVDVTDAHGNTINYTWSSEETSAGMPFNCSPTADLSLQKFVRALRLSQVTYGNGHLRVRLDYTGRNDIAWDHDKSNSWNFYPTFKLSTVSVEAQLPSLAWAGVRTYTLGHSNFYTAGDARQTLLNLVSITEGGGGLSETTTFGINRDLNYGPCEFDYLPWIQNAYGGKVSFTTAEPGYCNADSLRGEVLATRTETDLVTNQSATWTYHHGNDWDEKAHGYASVWVDRPEGAEVHHFWTTAYVNGQPITNLAGREKERWECASQTNGACSNWLTFTATDWISTTQSLPLANYSAMPLQDQPRFVYASEVRESQQNTTVKRTVYRYDPAAQVSPNGSGAAQYGNLTEVQEYAGAANGWAAQPYRTSRTRYYPNHAEWIINRPAAQQVYAGRATLVAETRSYYDHHANLADAPDPGDLTRQEQVAVRSGQYEDASRWIHRDYSYDSYGNQTLVQDELEQPTTTCYDGWFHAFPLKSTNALGHSSSAYYHGVPGGSCAVADGSLSFGAGRFGLLERSQDPNGVSTAYTYDDLGRVTSTVESPNDSASPTRTFAYRTSAEIGLNQPFWVQEAVRDDGGETNYRYSYTFYDGFGRILQRSTEAPRLGGAGRVQYIETRNAYDWRDAKRYESVPAYVLAESDGSTVYHPVTNWATLPHTRYDFDPYGRLSKTVAPDLTAQRTYYSVTTAPQTRLLTAAIDANNHMTIHERDPFGRLVAAKQFEGVFSGEPGWSASPYATATYAYDVADRLETIAGPAAPATRIYYDGLGRKERMEDVDLGAWRYSYKATGALETQTNAEACVTTFSYDDVGRLTGKSYSGPQKCATAAVSYVYDEGMNGIGRRTSMRDGSGSASWQYDVRGRAIAETRTISDTAFTTYRTYRSDNSLATLTYPDGEEVTYGYDAAGRVTLINSATYEGSGQAADYLVGAAYTALGQPANLQYGNNSVVGYTYHPADFRLQTITAPGVSLSYAYDPAGNVQTITDTLQTTAVTTFSYDELNRLRSARGAYTADYSYSPNGNLLTKSEGGSSVSLTYPAPGHAHAPASVNGVSYSYDNNGNATADGRRAMSYDAENRLSRVVSGTLTTTFTYDGDGNLAVRVAPDGTKTLYVSPAFEVTVSNAAPPPPPTPSPRPGHKVYLPWVSSSALSCSTLIDGHPIQISKYYLLGQKRIAQRSACNGATTVFYYHDLLGSTAATSAGESARYWPYGNMRSGDLNSTDYRFTGQRNDSSINLYLMGARWYDPYLSRWIQPDTIVPEPGNPQDLNRYSYCRNNPLVYIDKDGHFPFLILGVALIAAGVGAGINEYHQVSNYAQAHNMTWWDAFVSKDLKLDQGSMVTSAVTWGLTAGAAAEAGPLIAAGTGLAVQQAGLWFDSPQVFGAGTQVINGAAQGSAVLYGAPTSAGTEKAPAGAATTTLYRAVTQAEYEQVMATGRLQAGGSVEGKYFAEQLDHAAAWGDAMYGNGNYRIVQLDFATDVAGNFYRWDILDRIGPARYATMDQLNAAAITIIEVK